MKTDYKAGDIVELLNYEIPDSGRIGYFMNNYGMIPQVGHKYYVAYDTYQNDIKVSLICGNTSYADKNKPNCFYVNFYQVCLYNK